LYKTLKRNIKFPKLDYELADVFSLGMTLANVFSLGDFDYKQIREMKTQKQLNNYIY